MKLVVATRNPGKVAELQRLLGELGEVTLLSLDDVGFDREVIEDEETFEGNALKKAREVHEATGLPVLADDSGLSVDALGGAPGVLSARYAGQGATDARNNERLLRELSGVPPERRSARFTCVLALVGLGEPLVVRGTVEGRILGAPRGRAGFGYDPLFEVEGSGRTAAELAPADKDRVSHRGRAARELVARLRQRG